MRPNSSTDRDGRGRRLRLLTVLGTGVVALGVTSTLAAVTARTAPSQQEIRDTPAPAAQVAAEADAYPALPPIKTPVDEPKVLDEVYTFVAENPEVAKYIPCFCACGRNKIHKSIEDCFIKSRGTTRKDLVWSTHGAECMICMTVGAEARRLTLQGETVSAIRDEIERTLAPKFKFHTDTPLPPTQ